MNKLIVYLLLLGLIDSSKTKEDDLLPIITLDHDTTDIGTLKKEEKKSAIVKISNEGNDTLRIDNIGVSCGCTNTRLEKKIIPPDSISYLHILYESKKSNDTGTFYKSIVIRNNSKEPFKIFTLKGRITQNILE